MDNRELYLKTAFCCMACDGEIAAEEVELIKTRIAPSPLLAGLDVEKRLNLYIDEINRQGGFFLQEYLGDLSKAQLSPEEQLELVDVAIMTIEADNRIEYAEVKFFKKIRSRLSISDEQILRKHPDKEDFLLPDINVDENLLWGNITFPNISFNEKEINSYNIKN